MEQKNEEIDLLELSRNMMVRFYHYSQRRYKLLGIFIFSGAIVGIGLYVKNKNIFENKIIATSYVVQPAYTVNIINSLNMADKESISQLLDLNKKEAENLLSIKADTIEQIKKMGSIKLNTIYRNEIELDKIYKGIINFINTNNYVSRELELYKRYNLAILEKLNTESLKLDSLEKNIIASTVKSEKTNSNVSIYNDKMTFYHDDIIKLENQKQNILNANERLTALDIISGVETKIEKNRLTETIFKMMAIFFGIGFFVSIVLEFTRQVRNIEQLKK